ncbi:MAG: preprotein translocase subunit SecY [Clostridiales bacterium]|nr:preprotein translocase subunit SecY [Clostridiales bacterium]MDK2933526.1 preprotein translocase subunit SecY [Clostridiales bacterium]
MFQILRNAWKIPDLRKRILYTIALLIIFRLGSHIPVPGMDKAALQQLIGGNNSLFGFLDTLTGGAFGNATIFAMSITPYINASIIMQLLTVAIPSFERLAKEGEEGRKILAQYTRYGTVILGFIQATGLYFGLSGAITERGILSFITITLTFTAGTAFLMWLGEQITEKGIGNGISLLIFAGIVSRGPSMVSALYANYINKNLNIFTILLFVIFALGVIAAVVVMNQAERRIPVQYAKRVVGRKMYGGQSTHIPIKVSLAGVIPIIFAMSIMAFPSTIAQFFTRPQAGTFWAKFLDFISPSSWFYGTFYFILIIFFTYFYTAIYFNPIEIANNMKKNGGFIPGIRPGKPTSDYINKVLSRITLAGAVFLGLVAVLPIFINYGIKLNGLAIGGTSILIVVSVALETVKQLESQMLMRHYKGFLE